MLWSVVIMAAMQFLSLVQNRRGIMKVMKNTDPRL